jgi:hypothetical protein
MLCYHCCNPYQTQDLSLPVKYMKETFETYGHYCSWECMKAYVIYSVDDVKFNKFTLITLMRHKMGISGNVRDAPPKHMLKCFGGTMSIDEFRSTNASYTYLPVPMIKINPLIEKNTNISCVSHEEAHKVFEQTPEHKLQRKKTNSVINKLEQSMGLIKQN